jgi:hypothetical protein
MPSPKPGLENLSRKLQKETAMAARKMSQIGKAASAMEQKAMLAVHSTAVKRFHRVFIR